MLPRDDGNPGEQMCKGGGALGCAIGHGDFRPGVQKGRSDVARRAARTDQECGAGRRMDAMITEIGEKTRPISAPAVNFAIS